MPTPAETIAQTIADIRQGNVQHHCPNGGINADALARARLPQPVIDVTSIYHTVATKQEFRPYDDYPCCVSPWDLATFAYRNVHGNAMLVQTLQTTDYTPWQTDNPVEWDRVKWNLEAVFWAGGYSRGKRIPTIGPLFVYFYAIYEDGTIADIRWIAVSPGRTEDDFVVPSMTLAAALTFLSCSNVESATPKRPFPVRKRLREAKVNVQEIVVRAPGNRTRRANTGRGVDSKDTPLTCVRGHFARYGPEYGNGLLFGRHEGRFWRPARATGGQIRDYRLQPKPEP
jgi:hypothetical protein